MQIPNCLKKIKYDLCSRCAERDYKKLSALGLTVPSQDHRNYILHHCGPVNEYLTPSSSINKNFIDNYFDDVEHGFFHGICSCIVAYIINSTIDPHTWASIVLHDFLKPNGYTQETHDTHLKSYFSKLHPITYRHSKLIDTRTKWVLIRADRIELRRYQDYRKWIDSRYKNSMNDLNIDIIQQIDKFYSETRPALLYFYKNRAETFIRHGYESYKHPYTDNGLYPPKSSYWKRTRSYPIEIDNPPFMNEQSNVISRRAHCSNHGGVKLWNRIKGYITLNDFAASNGTVDTMSYRDHLMARSDIDINDWVFITMNNDTKDAHMLDFLRNSRVRMVDQHVLYDFFAIYQLLYNRLKTLSLVAHASG